MLGDNCGMISSMISYMICYDIIHDIILYIINDITAHAINNLQLEEMEYCRENFTSGAIRSRNRKGRLSSRIRIRSPVRCFPV
jgi:hypothetical protein